MEERREFNGIPVIVMSQDYASASYRRNAVSIAPTYPDKPTRYANGTSRRQHCISPVAQKVEYTLNNSRNMRHNHTTVHYGCLEPEHVESIRNADSDKSYRATLGFFAVMNIEGSAFRLGGGPGLPNRESGGVPMPRFGGLLAVITGGAFRPGNTSDGCRSSSSWSSAPSLWEICALGLRGACKVVGCFPRSSVVAVPNSDTVLGLFGRPPVRALNLSSLSRNDLSAVGFSCLEVASGGLGSRGALGRLAVPGSALFC